MATAELHRRQSGCAAPAKQSEEYRLRLVICGMPGHRVGSEQVVASGACPRLEIRTILELGEYAAERHTEAIGGPLCGCGLVVGVVTNAVMDVDRGDIEACGAGKRDQCTRVRPSGEGAGDGRSSRWEGAAREEFAGEPGCVGSQRSWWRRCRLPLGCFLASTLNM